MSRFATGVAAVTGLDQGRLYGFSVQSFSSLSIDPPLILFCPQKTSSSWPHIKKAEAFCVNLLADFQHDLSESLAVPGPAANIQTGRSPFSGAPYILNALAYIECRLEREVDGGDHTIAICAVEGLAVVNSRGSALVYFRGNYHSVG